MDMNREEKPDTEEEIAARKAKRQHFFDRLAARHPPHDPEEDIIADSFPVSLAQKKKIDVWFADVQKRLIAEKKAKTDFLGGTEGENVYYGAIGGGLTYSFHGTSLGLILVVKESLSGEELDVTDYDSW